jgi:AraC-like DNA-binding protein
MDTLLATRSPLTRLYPPGMAASAFLRGFLTRDTRGCRLAGDALLNRFPANGYCTLTWVLDGEAVLLSDGGGQRGLRVAGCMASGCQTQPYTSRNRGDIHGFFAMFYPDAFHALFGVDLAGLQDRFVDVRDVLPAHGQALADAVFAAGSDAERQAIVERFVLEGMAARPLPAWVRLRRMGQRVTLGVACALLGIGPRQLQRLALREAGSSLQTLLKLRRGERAFFRAQRRLKDEGHAAQSVSWAEHALDNDYADQSHMVRDCKAQTGRTPSQLFRDVQREEADWIYRLEFGDVDGEKKPAEAG